MEARDVLIEAVNRIRELVQLVTAGLDNEGLVYHPTPESTTIAWLLWHLTRVQDHDVSEIAQLPQAWIADNWHRQFGMPANSEDVGRGYTSEQVAGVRPRNAAVVADYHTAVSRRTIEFLSSVVAGDLDHNIDPSNEPPESVGQRLVNVIGDGLEHVGTVRYLRRIVDQRQRANS